MARLYAGTSEAAIGPWSHARRHFGRHLGAALILALCGASQAVRAEQVVLEDRVTPFQHLVVVEDAQRQERYLYSDDRRYLQGMISLRRPQELMPGYLRSSLLGLAVAPENPKTMLFVGLGAGSLPRYLSTRFPNAQLDAVEIDPEVPPIARRWFALPERKNLRIIVREGREFINLREQRYDFVLMDAYFGAEVPRHLATLEFMQELRQVLRPGGVVVANLAAPEFSADFWPVVATYRAAFRQVRVLATDNSQALVLIAADIDAWPDAWTLAARIGRLQSLHHIDVDLARLATLAPPWGNAQSSAPVLRDAPSR